METQFRILLFPWLAHGHLNPFFELAKKLAKTNFKTYICSTPINLASIQISSDSSSIELVQLHMPASPELPPELHTTRNLPSDLIPALIQNFQLCDMSFSQVLTSLKPDLLIYDLFQPWSAKLALSMGIPSVFFATGCAAACSYYHHFYTNGSATTYPFPAIYLEDHERIDPRLSALALNIKDAEQDFFLFGNFKLSTEIVLLKSCREVEAEYIDYLSGLCKKRIVLTSPLIAESDGVDDGEKFSEIMNWLSEKTRFSTLYISFGSEYFLSKDEIHQIAKALEQSEVNFLWVIRSSAPENETPLEEALPKGFLQRSKNRGIIVRKWVPQKRILAHQSVAAFVSHCGWGSITESLYFGVPVIGMPMMSDQPVNARFVVAAGVGVKVERKCNEIYMGEAIAKAINEVIPEDNVYQSLKNRAAELSKKIRENEEAEVDVVDAELLKICKENKPKA